MMRFLLFAALIAALIWAWRTSGLQRSEMSAADAAKLLEIPLESDADRINAAHRRLISKVHPDNGGSAELAARVNNARDVLLRRLTKN